MNSLKKFALVAFAACVAGLTQADVLYWQVDPSASDASYTKTDAAGAMLYRVPDSEPYSYANNVTPVSDWVALSNGKTDSVQSYELDPNYTTGYSFFVELYNESGDTLWTQYASTYEQLLNSQAISTGGIGAPTGLGLGGMNGAAIPEPTSGLMLLIGGAMLALRRRRRA